MPLKTLFLNPPSFENFDGGAGSRWPATREIESYWYPVWLAYPAGMLEGSRLLDAPPHHVSAEETINIAKDYEFLVLFTSTPGFPGDIRLVETIKRNNPHIKICFVGPHVSVLPERALRDCHAIDFVARKEFDYAVVEFAQGKPLKPQHFNLPKQPNTAKAPPVKFQQGRRIAGSQNWQGRQYTVFRNYQSQWHDRNWWRGHYGNNITFVFGSPYYWNAGYWFPAWGYAPSVSYVYDGPIYGYNGLSPDRVTVNVQEQLARAGYYDGPIDGILGSMTREAIAAYQADNGLAITSAIDEPTLATLVLV